MTSYYTTHLVCVNCGKKFGPFSYGAASETLPICLDCKSTRKKRDRSFKKLMGEKE